MKHKIDEFKCRILFVEEFLEINVQITKEKGRVRIGDASKQLRRKSSKIQSCLKKGEI